MNKRAIVFGSTGLTGGILVELLLNDSRYSSVLVINRKPLSIKHQKLHEELVDFDELDRYEHLLKGEEVFCCIGTTKAKTPNESKYRQIDFDIPVTIAKMAASRSISTLVVMSSMGANSKSSVFYSRLKGEMEEAVRSNGIKNTIIIRPSLISGKRNEKRFGESVVKKLMNLINPLLIGSLKAYRSISPDSIAKAMIYLANHPSGTVVVSSDQLQQIAKHEHRN